VVTIFGAGYVGSSLIQQLVQTPAKIQVLDPSPEVVVNTRQLWAGSVVAEVDPSKLGPSDVAVICVPTPIDDDLRPIHDYVDEAIGNAASLLKTGGLIVLESTVGPGFTESKQKTLAHPKIHLAFSPERVNPGSTLDVREIPKIVSANESCCLEKAMDFYISAGFRDVVASGSTTQAELAKLLENSFRLVNIAFINEFADHCISLGADPDGVIQLASTKPFGFTPFFPGLGVGGHCIPVDPVFLTHFSSHDELHVLKKSQSSTLSRPARIANSVISKFQDAKGHTPRSALIVGATYKPGVNDFRNSPSVLLALELIERGLFVNLAETLSQGAQLPREVEGVALVDNLEQVSEVDLSIFVHGSSSDLQTIRGKSGLALDSLGRAIISVGS
jgi:UDP-N-acetyl-D-glucosamine dehydrogenase